MTVDNGDIILQMKSGNLKITRQKHIASDFVITPDWCAKDIITYFKPTGKILDPCRGEGAFYKSIPQGSYWCEIRQGKDFFDFNKKVDWIIGNPPYSIFDRWLMHSYDIADNIVYLVPTYKIFNPLGIIRMIKSRGHVKHLRIYDVGRKIPWARGRPIAAAYIKKGYYGPMEWSFYKQEDEFFTDK